MKIKKPTFIIVGSAKCGTTALASILANHPDCCMSNPKEVSFFQDTIDFEPNSNYLKGWGWYQQAFNHYNGEVVVGEATPSYSDRTRSPKTAKRIHKFNPEMKIIYMVRDPLEKQISGWRMQYAHGLENAFPWRRECKWALNGFDYWMRMQREVNQWDVCRYHFQLEAYKELFPGHQIHVSFLEDWRANKDREITKILQFLVLEPEKYNPQLNFNANIGADRKIDRPYLKKFRTIPAVSKIVKAFPEKWHIWIREYVVKNAPNIPDPKLSREVHTQFIEYVSGDAKDLLSGNSREISLWSSIKV